MRKKIIRFRTLIALAVAIMLAISVCPVLQISAAKKSKTVSSAKTLKKALKNGYTKITYKSKKTTKLNIPKGDYSKVSFKINAPKAKVTNKGTFNNVTVLDAASFKHSGKVNNELDIQDKKLTVTIAKGAEVDNLIISSKDSSIKLSVSGSVNQVTVDAKSDLNVSGKAKGGISIVVSQSAEGTSVESAISVKIDTSAGIEVTLLKGAESSEIKQETEDAGISLTNNTKKKIKVTDSEGESSFTASGDTMKLGTDEDDEPVPSLTPEPTGTEGESGENTPTGTEGNSGENTPTGTEGDSGENTPTGTEGNSGENTPTGTESNSGEGMPTGIESASGEKTPTGTVTPSGTENPTITPKAAVTPTPSVEPSSTPKPAPTVTPDPTGTSIPTSGPTNTPTPTPDPTNTLTPTPDPTNTPIPTPGPTDTPTPTPDPTDTPTPTPDHTDTPTPTPDPTDTPTPTPDPTDTPTPTPTDTPTPTPGVTAVAVCDNLSEVYGDFDVKFTVDGVDYKTGFIYDVHGGEVDFFSIANDEVSMGNVQYSGPVTTIDFSDFTSGYAMHAISQYMDKILEQFRNVTTIKVSGPYVVEHFNDISKKDYYGNPLNFTYQNP